MRLVTNLGVLPCCSSPWGPARGDGTSLSGGFPFSWYSPILLPPLLGAPSPAHPVAPIPTLLHLRVAQQPPPGVSPITPNVIYTQLASYSQNIKRKKSLPTKSLLSIPEIGYILHCTHACIYLNKFDSV